ncbi:MAG: 4a-hydroxytetrahydrobiopterin dehydratase [Leptospiraceae bacterium]|nr:4a-hydroxytetrahydrobiopterin dehydratase [Leptospiraceae bacterium]
MPLDQTTIAAALQTLPGWFFEDDCIKVEYQFQDFSAAFAFMTRVALAAEKCNHHPDWGNSWNRVMIALQSHDTATVTERDLALARQIHSIYQSTG